MFSAISPSKFPATRQHEDQDGSATIEGIVSLFFSIAQQMYAMRRKTCEAPWVHPTVIYQAQ